ncbi:hypothetical protein RFI_17806, partial [Reticulomyxa filosa]
MCHVLCITVRYIPKKFGIRIFSLSFLNTFKIVERSRVFDYKRFHVLCQQYLLRRDLHCQRRHLRSGFQTETLEKGGRPPLYTEYPHLRYFLDNGPLQKCREFKWKVWRNNQKLAKEEFACFRANKMRLFIALELLDKVVISGTEEK